MARAIRRRLVGLAARAGEVGLGALGIRPPEALLLLGHMRSGSTLLLHVLLTSPEIAGMGERNAVYASRTDLSRLVVVTRLDQRVPLLTHLRYVADQINHSELTPDPTLFEHPRVRLLFLLRRPEDTLASLIDLNRKHYDEWTDGYAVAYYIERLHTLAGYARRLAGGARAAFCAYESLTDRSAETLEELRRFLGIQSRLSVEYGAHDFTGRRGDPGATIRRGRIEAPRRHAPPELPADQLVRARQAYQDCVEALSRFALPSSVAR